MTARLEPESSLAAAHGMDRETEEVLVRQAQSGDVGAYDRLVQEYYRRLYALVYNMTGHCQDTEDVLQEVFVKAFKALKGFKGKSSFSTWLYRVATNQTINFLRKHRRRSILPLESWDEAAVRNDEGYRHLVSHSSPFRDVALSELQKKLNDALQKLSDKHRMVVVLHDLQGMPYEEIASVVPCSLGTVRSRLFYARRQLQAALAEYVQ